MESAGRRAAEEAAVREAEAAGPKALEWAWLDHPLLEVEHTGDPEADAVALAAARAKNTGANVADLSRLGLDPTLDNEFNQKDAVYLLLALAKK